MERLCERPGCSDPASVAYGMRPEDLVFWLDQLRAHRAADHGVLCRRHADSMIVPRGWTLDDLREPDLHLFRPPSDDSGQIPRRRVRRATAGPRPEQLALGVVPDIEPPETGVTTPAVAPSASEPVGDDVESAGREEPSIAELAVDEPETTPWMPVFDTDDDLDGLLAARSPLLSRAFRGERPS